MRKHLQKISFLVNKKELALLEEACDYGADSEEILEKVIKEKNKYRLEFLYEELDDLAGFIASCANHEAIQEHQEEWDALSDKIENFLKLSEKMSVFKNNEGTMESSCSLRYFIFDVSVINRENKKAVRRIQIAETKSLYNFAKVITQAFDFYFDHCFGFYDNLKKPEMKEAYELFVDIGEGSTYSFAKGVKKTKISKVFKAVGKRMIFLFDYGDGWQFTVELKEICQAEKWDLKPKILESIGDAPLQYPPLDEEI
ncbi:MAG: hypothetical protein HQL15_03370 [Candidatus Omnitrophica bacterium]|nr:hypothetical protein [Candidatus Omnitrophota bacterium]